ncbi:MAG: hypothetical protein WBM53_09590 [Maribacter sp.]
MTNNSIKDKLNYFAHIGTQDNFQYNRMVKKSRVRTYNPNIEDDIKTVDGLRITESIQLQLFQ